MVVNRSDISILVEQPPSIGQEEIQSLQKQADRMPWCSAYRVLLARGYSNEESFLQNKYLRLAATYTGDKEVLFQFMTSSGLELEAQNAVESINVTEPLVDRVQEEQMLQDVPSEGTEAEVKILTTNEEVPIEEEKVVEDVAETPKEVKEKPVSVPKNIEQKLENDKTPIDFDSIVTYDPLKELEPLEVEPVPNDNHLSFDYVAYNPEEELNKLIEEKEEEEGHNFLFWINNLDDSQESKSKNPSKSPDHVQNLLDQFLATKRSRPIQNREFYKAEVKAEEK